MGIACVFPLLLSAAWLLRPRICQIKEIGRGRWWFAIGVVGIALVLTDGRESIGATVLGIVLIAFWSGKLKRLALPGIAMALILFLMPAVQAHIADTLTFKEGSAEYHLGFLESGWNEAPKLIVGRGLGEAGGWAFSLAGVNSDVGENSYFELMAQAGLLSVVLMVGFLVAASKQALWYSKRVHERLISAALVAVAANIAVRCAFAIFSGSLFGVIPMASFLFFCGAAFTTLQRAGLKQGLVLREIYFSKDGTGARIRDRAVALPVGRIVRVVQ